MPAIQGYNLEIDNSVIELGKASHTISSSARGLFYVLILCCLLSFTAFMNTRFGLPWIRYRMERLKQEITNEKMALLEIYTRNHFYISPSEYFHHFKDSLFHEYCGPEISGNRDSCKRCFESIVNNKAISYGIMSSLDKVPDTDRIKVDILMKERKLDALQRNSIENVQTLRMPIVGIAFDVDDLGIISGLAFIVLLFLIHSLLKRKVYNLQIALIAATNRYPDDADANSFMSQGKTVSKDVLAAINRSRRKFHYNFLSFHEGYLIIQHKFIEQEDEYYHRGQSTMNKLSKFLTKAIFFTPVGIMTLVLFNDFVTYEKAASLSEKWASISIVATCLLFVIVLILCKQCTRQQLRLEKIYRKFREADYKYLPPEKRIEHDVKIVST